MLSAALHWCEVFEERNSKSVLELYSSYLVRENMMMTGPSYLSFLEKNVVWFGLVWIRDLTELTAFPGTWATDSGR